MYNLIFKINKSISYFSYKGGLILTLWISIPVSLFMVLNYLISEPNHSINFVRLIYIVVSNFLLFYIIFIININIIPLQKKSSIKYVIWIFGTITVAIVLSINFSKLMFLLDSVNKSVIERTTIINIIKDLVIVVIADITTLFVYITEKEKEAAVEQERFITENIRIRYEVLKNQIDPHFIFNSLNTLDGLIGIDDERAHEYLENMSLVFRYVINNKEITHLSDELAFTESFATMMKIRFGDNFRIEYTIDEKYITWFIMPISLQLLVENAIKHNVMIKNSPLIVKIETTPDNTIMVTNIINLKKEPEQGAGIGLANLTDRYKHLFNKEISITQSDVFCVEIPLIKKLHSKPENV